MQGSGGSTTPAGGERIGGRSGSGGRNEEAGLEPARGVHGGAVGFIGPEEGLNVGNAEATGQLLIHAVAALAAAFNVEGAEVVALDEG